MENKTEYCIIVEGNYFNETEAAEALREPFIEDFVEQTNNYRLHNFDEIEVVRGIALGDLAITMIEDEVFEITCRNSSRFFNEQKAKMLADAIKRASMFDEIEVQPLK